MRPSWRTHPHPIPLVIGLVVLVGGCSRQASIRPDLVLISIDALRADALDCYGGRRDLGVEACALGDEGARYVWAFAAASSGGPAAASLLTSLHPSQHGVRDSAAQFLPQRVATAAEALVSAGYETAAFVASPELNRSRNLQQGFGVYDDGLSSAQSDRLESVGDRAIAWTDTARSPWLVWVHFSEPHPPGKGSAPWTPADYEKSIRHLDRRLSQLIAVLDARPTPPGVLLVGLHGQRDAEPGSPASHGRGVDLAEIRVPLLWRPPRTGIGPMVGRRITTPVSTLDVAPTLLDSAGVALPGAFEGRPLPLADSVGESQPARALFAEHPLELAVIVGAEYAAIERTPSDGAADSIRTALLWPPGDRSSEKLPALDSAIEAARRHARLRPTLDYFLARTQAERSNQP